MEKKPKTSLVVQWLRFCAYTAGGVVLIPGQGNRIPPGVWYSQTNKPPKLSAGCRNTQWLEKPVTKAE